MPSGICPPARPAIPIGAWGACGGMNGAAVGGGAFPPGPCCVVTFCCGAGPRGIPPIAPANAPGSDASAFGAAPSTAVPSPTAAFAPRPADPARPAAPSPSAVPAAPSAGPINGNAGSTNGAASAANAGAIFPKFIRASPNRHPSASRSMDHRRAFRQRRSDWPAALPTSRCV